MRCKLIIFGCGGHGRVVLEAARQMDMFDLVGFLDANAQLWGQEVLGLRVLGGDDKLADIGRDTAFLVGVGTVGHATPRRKIFEKAIASGLTPATIIHPTAIVSPSAQIGAGSVLLPGSVVHTGATLGVNVIVNTGAIVEHDCHVGDHTHVATGAALSGAVTIGRDAHIGAGSTILQRINIGDGAVVGAGAVVTRDVPDRTTVVGVPARQLIRETGLAAKR